MKNKTFLILTFIVISIVTVFIVAYLNINTAYNNSQASTPDTNPNFKYFGIIGADSYVNGWNPPTQVDENLITADQNLQNIMIMIFNPRINDPAAFANYFNNYAAEARKRNTKLIIDTFFLTSGNSVDPVEIITWGTDSWQAKNQWRLDLYNSNKDVIYAFSFDEPSLKRSASGYKEGYIRLTKKLRELFPTIGTLAIEFRPDITDRFDSELHQYTTDLGFDAYENYWQSQLSWIGTAKKNIGPNKKLWLVPQGYVDGPNGIIRDKNAVKDLLKAHIDYAKTDSQVVGILSFNWSITMNGHDNRAVACIKEMIDPNSEYYTPGYKELIQQTVLELKAKNGTTNNTATATPTPTTTQTTTKTPTSTQSTLAPSAQTKFPIVINYNQGTKVAVTEYNCDTRRIAVTVCDTSNYNGKVLTRAWLVDQNNNRNFLYTATGQNEIDISYEKSFCGGVTGHSYEYTIPTKMELGKLQIVAWDVNSDGNTDWNKYEFPNNMPDCESKMINSSSSSSNSSSSTTTKISSATSISSPSSSSSHSSKSVFTANPNVVNKTNLPMEISFGNNAKAKITNFTCNTKQIAGIVCDADNYDRKVLTRMWIVNDNGRRDYFAAMWVSDAGSKSEEQSFCGGTNEHSFSLKIPDNVQFDSKTDKVQLVTWDILPSGMTDFNKALLPNKVVNCE